VTRRTKAHSFEHNQLGVTFFQSGAVHLAIEQFRLAIKRAPGVPSYWLNLGIALLDSDVLDEAQSALERAIKLQPDNQSAYYHLAQLYKKLGDELAVQSAYKRAIEINPHTYLADRACEYLENWHPRIVTSIGANGCKIKED
jgi:tetratricopeptide (TPR) repeat protein